MISAEVTGKLLVFAVVFVAVVASYQAIPTDGFVARAAGSAVFLLNPFVFGRLHYGQVDLLAGYAVLPWVASRLRHLCVQPGWAAGMWFGVSLSLLAVFTLHLVLVACWLSAAVLVAFTAVAPGKTAYTKRVVASLLVTAATAGALCAYWLVPFIIGKSPEAIVVAQTGAGQLNAYAAVPDPSLGLLPNLLGMYGFWAENSGRFSSMKAFVPAWPAVLLIVLVIAAIGVVAVFQKSRDALGPWVVGLVFAAAIGVLLEMGVSHSLTAGFVRWLDVNLPAYRGMRDAGKWAALLGLVYSQLFGLGVGNVLELVRKIKLPAQHIEWMSSAAIGLLLAIPLYYGNGLLYGAHGEIRPSPYPPGWYAADRLLAADAHPGRALFLPWHEYMSYSFIQNQNKVVAPPAPNFFSVPVLVSTNAEVPGVAPPTDPDQVAIDDLVAAGGQGDWAAVLRSLNIRYVLVAHEVDWASFRYLDAQAGLVKVGDFGSIVVYRNDSP